MRYLERAHAQLGKQPQLLYDLASSQFFAGDFAGAKTTLDSLLAEAPGSGAAHYLRATLRQQTAERNHVASLRDSLARAITKPVDRAACLYALVKELEDLGEHEQSIAALLEGTQLMRSTLKYNLGAELANIGALSQTFTADALAEASAGHDEQGTIFIVGMPRSGTTLVESILTRHPSVGAAGELSDFGLVLAAASRELADYYAAYKALMRHWHEMLPGVILDVNYEDLVANPETEARRIVEWCGLDWRPGLEHPSATDKPSATASAAQVRQPIHTRSVHKWQHYATQLAPLRARLTEHGVIAAE